MKTFCFTESRANLAQVLDHVVEHREEAIIMRAGHEPVVVVPLADYETLRESAYLTGSTANARRLLDSIDRLENRSGTAHNPIET